MADTLCGPSNALQTFTKHTSVDRTLQQDRLTPRHSPAESFRSPPGPQSVALDAEFEAFQAGNPLEIGYPEPPFLQHKQPSLSPAPHNLQPDWASDFQSLQIAEQRSSPFPSSQFHQHAPMQKSSPHPWQNDFFRHNQYQSKDNATSVYSSMAPQTEGFYHPSMPMYRPSAMMATGSSQATGPSQQSYTDANKNLDDEAFANAFDEIQAWSIDHQPESKPPSTQNLNEAGEGSRHEAIGVQSVEKPIQADNESNVEADELARTAGALLENVKSDTSKKFQESSFLSLMRQLRDREVTVEGDKFVDTTQPQALHPGGTNYPHDASTADEDLARDGPHGLQGVVVPERPANALPTHSDGPYDHYATGL